MRSLFSTSRRRCTLYIHIDVEWRFREITIISSILKKRWKWTFKVNGTRNNYKFILTPKKRVGANRCAQRVEQFANTKLFIIMTSPIKISWTNVYELRMYPQNRTKSILNRTEIFNMLVLSMYMYAVCSL